jgi:predicted nucleic acid-binding protein
LSSIFLETSALLRAVFGESGGASVERKLRCANSIVASRLLLVETQRALLRAELDDPALGRHLPDLHHELLQLWAVISFLEMTRDICELACRIAPRSSLRTLDAIHLATYQTARRMDLSLEMLTYDDRLLREL